MNINIENTARSVANLFFASAQHTQGDILFFSSAVQSENPEHLQVLQGRGGRCDQGR